MFVSKFSFSVNCVKYGAHFYEEIMLCLVVYFSGFLIKIQF